MQRRYIWIVLLSIILLAILGLYSVQNKPGYEEPAKQPQEMIEFDGTIKTNGTFVIHGRIEHAPAFTSTQREFDNVSLQLYSENGSLVYSKCLGSLDYHGNISIDVAVSGRPKYVVFYTPDILELGPDIQYTVAGYEKIEGEYLLDPVFTEEEYPVSVTGRPCQ